MIRLSDDILDIEELDLYGVAIESGRCLEEFSDNFTPIPGYAKIYKLKGTDSYVGWVNMRETQNGVFILCIESYKSRGGVSIVNYLKEKYGQIEGYSYTEALGFWLKMGAYVEEDIKDNYFIIK